MAVTPTQLRDGARKARIDESEVERRVAASRSYYAAYHRCRPIAESQGTFADSGGSHAEVIEALTRSRETQLKSIGYRLKQCRDLRVKADYHIGIDFPVEDAEVARSQCEKIWTTTEALGQAHPPL